MVGVGFVGKDGDGQSRQGAVKGFAPVGEAVGDGRADPAGGREGRVLPTGRGGAGAGRGRPRFSLVKKLGVGAVAHHVAVVAAPAIDVHRPTSPSLVPRGVLDPGRQHIARPGQVQAGGRDRDADGVRTDAPGRTFRGAIDVYEPEDISGAHLDAVDEDAHVVVGHTTDDGVARGGAGGGPGMGDAQEDEDRQEKDRLLRHHTHIKLVNNAMERTPRITYLNNLK